MTEREQICQTCGTLDPVGGIADHRDSAGRSHMICDVCNELEMHLKPSEEEFRKNVCVMLNNLVEEIDAVRRRVV